MTVSKALTVFDVMLEAWAEDHKDERHRDAAFARGILALKTSGPGTMTAPHAAECASWEEAAIVGALLLGSRDVYAAIMALPDDEFPHAAGFHNAALGRVFDVLTDAFDDLDDTYDPDDEEIQDALDRAGLYGVGPLEMDDALLGSLMRCTDPVFDFEAMMARPEGIRSCALAIRAARLARIEARNAAYRNESDDDGGECECGS